MLDIILYFCIGYCIISVIAIIYTRTKKTESSNTYKPTQTHTKSESTSIKEGRAYKKWKEGKEQYAAIIRKLPKDLVKNLYDQFLRALPKIEMVVPHENFPEKYTDIFMATKEVIDNNVYGTITKEQYEKIDDIINKHLKWVVDEYIPAANKANSNLMNSDGLDFGLITNSAADAMLYSAMNARAKVKGNNRHIREYKELIDKQFVDAIKKIEEIV